jgi:hypothetical protein
MILDAPDREVRQTMIRLRADAIERRYLELAIVCGHSMIRLGLSAIEAELAAFKPWPPEVDP